MILIPSEELAKIVKREENLSFELVEQALLKYSKKLDNEYQKNIQDLDAHSTNFLQLKKTVQLKYRESKK